MCRTGMPNSNGSGQNTIGYQPPSAYLYCYSGGAWSACSSTGGAVSTATVTSVQAAPYNATGNGKQAFSCSMTSGSPTLTCTDGTFSQSDRSKLIYVLNAGTGTQSTLQSTISAVTSSTVVTLADNAGASPSGVRATYGTDDTTAIQSAITAVGAMASGGTVFFPAGLYMVQPPNLAAAIPADLTINNSNITLLGQEVGKSAIECRGAWSLNAGAVVRGNCILIGSGSQNIGNISFQNLTLDGNSAGDTGNISFPANVSTGDGWDLTHKGIYIKGNVISSVNINNITVQNFMGEDVYHGGLTSQLLNLYINHSTFTNSNGSLLSYSAQWTRVLNSILSVDVGDCIENSVDTSTIADHIYSTNTFSSCLKGVDILNVATSSGNNGSITVDNNQFLSTTQTSFGVGNYGATRLSGVKLTNNYFKDAYPISINADNSIASGNLFQLDAVSQVDIMTTQTANSNFVFENNVASLTANAVTNGFKWTYPISLSNTTFTNTIIRGNIFPANAFTSGWQLYSVDGTIPTYWASISGQVPIYQRNTCSGCAHPFLGSVYNSAIQAMSTGNVTVYPVFDDMQLTSSSGALTITIAATKSLDGQELRLTSGDANDFTFVSDANISLPYNITIIHGTNPGSISFRYSSTSGKWVLQSYGGNVTGLGTMATQNASSIAVTGGTLTGVSVNGVTPTTAGSASAYLNGTGSYTAIPNASTSVFGISECDGTTITCSGGVFTATASGGNTTSTSLTTNTIPKANGATSLINSSISDTGSLVSTATPVTLSAAGAASAPGFQVTGTPFAGTGTTSYPLELHTWGTYPSITTWKTTGTAIGIAEPSGSTADFLNLFNNTTSELNITSGGSVNMAGSLVATGSVLTGLNLGFTSSTAMKAPSNGVLEIANAAFTSFTRMDFGGTTSSFAALCTSGTTITICGADGTAVGNLISPIFSSSAAQTTVSCATSGTAIFSQPEQGASDKKVLVHLAACLGTASYTYPTAFTNTPGCFAASTGTGISCGLVSTLTSTTMTITGTTDTGTLILEDY